MRNHLKLTIHFFKSDGSLTGNLAGIFGGDMNYAHCVLVINSVGECHNNFDCVELTHTGLSIGKFGSPDDYHEWLLSISHLCIHTSSTQLYVEDDATIYEIWSRYLNLIALNKLVKLRVKYRYILFPWIYRGELAFTCSSIIDYVLFGERDAETPVRLYDKVHTLQKLDYEALETL